MSVWGGFGHGIANFWRILIMVLGSEKETITALHHSNCYLIIKYLTVMPYSIACFMWFSVSAWTVKQSEGLVWQIIPHQLLYFAKSQEKVIILVAVGLECILIQEYAGLRLIYVTV